MPRARLIVPACPAVGATVRLSLEEAAHARARRLSPGDLVTLFDGAGMEAQSRLLRLTSTGADVLVESVSQAPHPEVDLSLFVAALRLERLSWVAEKATELSVARLIIVSTERSQRFRETASGIARLRRVAREAAKQCESSWCPEVEGPVLLQTVWALATGERFLFDLVDEPFPERLALGPAALLIGPEGGWTEDERRSARQSGWRAVGLPAGKLRAETAAVAAVVLARAALARSRA